MSKNPGMPIVPNKTLIKSLSQMVQDRDAEIARLRTAICEYQIKYWTLQYKTARFSRMMFGDLDDEDWSDEAGGGE